MPDTATRNETWLPPRDTRWMDRAQCRIEAGDFFPNPPNCASKEQKARYDQEVNTAKLICARCPVSAECLKDALDRGEHFGIWGGVDFYVSPREQTRRRRAS